MMIVAYVILYLLAAFVVACIVLAVSVYGYWFLEERRERRRKEKELERRKNIEAWTKEWEEMQEWTIKAEELPKGFESLR